MNQAKHKKHLTFEHIVYMGYIAQSIKKYEKIISQVKHKKTCNISTKPPYRIYGII